MILLPGRNSGLIGSNKRKTLLNLLSMLTMWPLMRPCCHLVHLLSNKKWRWGWDGVFELSELLSINDLRIWLAGRVCDLNWDLLLSFCRCNWIRMTPAIVSMLYDGDVLNASNIHIAALLWSFPKVFREYKRGVLW